jgi:nucleotide-binding universal stress UspA family protein
MSLRLGERTTGFDVAAGGAFGNVLLATFGVPFDAEAAAFAVDSAVEAGRSLIVANIVELEPLPLSLHMGYDSLEYTPELAASLIAPARLAQSLGVRVERLRVKTPRRVIALVELVKERQVSLLVLGPDRNAVKPRLYRKAAAAVRGRLSCLVWLSWDLTAP